MRKLFFIPVVVMLSFVLSACDRGIVYSQFCSIPSGEWAIDEVAQFDYSITDAELPFRMIIYVRHTERYPYQNMWIFVDNGYGQDTIEFYLADDRGQWLGNKHHGFIEMPILYEAANQFPDTGTYHLTIQHGMRDSLLRGVTDIGLEVARVQN